MGSLTVQHKTLPPPSPPSPPPPPRRHQNYDPPSWNHEFIQSLETSNVDDMWNHRHEELIEEARRLFVLADDGRSLVAQLRLVDSIQQLGIGYHFQQEIRRALDFLNSGKGLVLGRKDLHSTSLLFRLLRENGYQISQGYKNCFWFYYHMRTCLHDSMYYQGTFIILFSTITCTLLAQLYFIILMI